MTAAHHNAHRFRIPKYSFASVSQLNIAIVVIRLLGHRQGTLHSSICSIYIAPAPDGHHHRPYRHHYPPTDITTPRCMPQKLYICGFIRLIEGDCIQHTVMTRQASSDIGRLQRPRQPPLVVGETPGRDVYAIITAPHRIISSRRISSSNNSSSSSSGDAIAGTRVAKPAVYS